MSHLHHAGQRAAAHPFFLAASLAAYQHAHSLSDQQLAEALGCSFDNLARLRLCRVPTTEQEITQVAARAQLTPQHLEPFLPTR